MSDRTVFEELRNLITEQRNPRTTEIDTKSVEEILTLINDEDRGVAVAVKQEIPYIAEAVDVVVEAFQRGGRLIYVGAGTSGRLGVLDASECPPTFGTRPEMVQGIVAGGYRALIRAQEGVEDRGRDGPKDLKKRRLDPKDVVCGIAASRRTPYVISAVAYARSIGCKTIYITVTPRAEMSIPVDVAICPVVGPEVVMGSTRMKAGTAQKMILNMITTAAMIRLGKVYENMMVDLQMTSQKLVERSKRTVMVAGGVDYETAGELLARAKGHVKVARVMALAGVDAEQARRRLEKADGFVRWAVDNKA